MLRVIEGTPEGSAAHAERWFTELDRELRAFVRARVANPSAAEDVTQDALLRIVRGLDQVRDGQRLGAWAYAVARSAVMDHYRAQARADRPEGTTEPEPEPREGAPSDVDSPPLASRILAAWLPGAIDGLPEPYRSTLRATELEGETHAALAAREGVSVSAIKSRVSRGRQKLRTAAERCCEVTQDARGRVVGLRGRNCGCNA